MKKKNAELDVDFIGGAGPLTKEQEKTISDFIKASKQKSVKQLDRKSKASSKKRAA